MKLLRFRRPGPSMIVALIALSVALSGTAGADPVGEISALITGKRIARNAITTKHVKNRSLLSADFKAGQLPRGARGAAGAAGGTGPQGSPGPGGTARAWAIVEGDVSPRIVRGKGFSSVRVGGSGTVGFYCLSGPGLDARTDGHWAGVFTLTTLWNDALATADDGHQCIPGEFQVDTIFVGDAAVSGGIDFFVGAP